jgi:glycosyltransferase involved in cell wall biosynthesis
MADNRKKNPDFSLVLACYNEESHLKNSIDDILKVLDYTNFTYEVIFVDDKSTDRTREIIKQVIAGKKSHPLKAVFHEKNTGRGGAVTSGIRIAAAEIVGYIDVDLEVSPLYIPFCVRKVMDGSDIVIGSRVYKVRANGAFRYLTHWVYLQLVRSLIKVKFLKDSESGYKFFRKSRIMPVLDRCENTHWFWSTEFVAHAFLQKLSFCQVPCLYLRNRDKKTTVKVLRDSWRYFTSLFRFYLKNKEALRARAREFYAERRAR